MKSLSPGALTAEEVLVALENIGYATNCPACMEIFYTGSTCGGHVCNGHEFVNPEELEVKSAAQFYLWTIGVANGAASGGGSALTDVRGARFSLAKAIERREPGTLKRALDAIEKENG